MLLLLIIVLFLYLINKKIYLFNYVLTFRTPPQAGGAVCSVRLSAHRHQTPQKNREGCRVDSPGAKSLNLHPS